MPVRAAELHLTQSSSWGGQRAKGRIRSGSKVAIPRPTPIAIPDLYEDRRTCVDQRSLSCALPPVASGSSVTTSHGQARVADNKLGSWHSEVEECLETILEG